MLILLELIAAVILIGIIVLLAYSMLFGGPYAPVGEHKIEAMMKLLNVKKGERAVDLGAGDGRIVVELARRGAEAHGYEINPVLVFIGRKKIKEAGLQGKAFMHMTDMWQVDLSKFSIVTVYLTAHVQPRLEKKFEKELQPGTRVVENYFKVPNWKPVKKLDTVYLFKV